MKSFCFLVPLTFLLLCPGGSFSQEGAALKIHLLMEDLDYQEAKDACEREFSTGGLGLSDLRELCRICGELAAAIGDKKEATRLFKLLLAVAPDAELGQDTSPKIRRLFHGARRFFKNLPPLKIEVRPPRSPRPGLPINLDVHVSADRLSIVKGVTLFYKEGRKGKSFKKTGAMGRPPYGMTIPSQKPGKIDYYVMALGEHGCVAEVGSAEKPLHFRVTEPEPHKTPVIAAVKTDRHKEKGNGKSGPFYGKWWFWTAVGAGVITAGAVTYLLIANEGSGGLPPASLGKRELPLMFDVGGGP